EEGRLDRTLLALVGGELEEDAVHRDDRAELERRPLEEVHHPALVPRRVDHPGPVHPLPSRDRRVEADGIGVDVQSRDSEALAPVEGGGLEELLVPDAPPLPRERLLLRTLEEPEEVEIGAIHLAKRRSILHVCEQTVEG